MTQVSDGHGVMLAREDGQVTLLIDGQQAMQAWERELTEESADVLCSFGSEFLEVGLGLGISALRIASAPSTTSHTVLEKHREVIDSLLAAHPELPAGLEIVEADAFDHVDCIPAESLDGISPRAGTAAAGRGRR